MKITNLEELSKLIEYYFSNDSSKINLSEENMMKDQIKKAIEKIDGATAKVKDMALEQLKEWNKEWKDEKAYYKYYGQIELVKFVCESLHDEDRIQLIKKYFESEYTNFVYGSRDKLKIDREHLLILLDYLPDELKITALTYAKPVDLIRIMGEINEIASDWMNKPKTRKYYKKYYNIFTKVLEEQNKN